MALPFTAGYSIRRLMLLCWTITVLVACWMNVVVAFRSSTFIVSASFKQVSSSHYYSNTGYHYFLRSVVEGRCHGSRFPMSPTTSLFSSNSNDATASTASAAAAASPPFVIPSSWSELLTTCESTVVGQALRNEVELRRIGKGSAHVQNQLRLFDSDQPPKITLYRDHAGWCPYCQKTMLLIEEKRIPIKIELVPMRSYGDKPREFLQKVPSGLLPAIEIEDDKGGSQIITESQIIMELLDEWHPTSQGYLAMLPTTDAGWSRYQSLARLERELFSWWCTLVFRPEGPSGRGGSGSGGLLGGLLGGGSGKSNNEMSGAMRGFLDSLQKVEQALLSTKGPWFFDDFDHPTMIDFIYVSHVERMLASVAYWKGVNLRDVKKWNLVALNRWLEAFEKREAYLAFKSDYYTNVMDIPPQYGPGYDGGFEQDRIAFSERIRGWDGSWRLPLSFDDPLQPLYKGPPLPLCVLQAANLPPSADGTYEDSDASKMEQACRHMAAWKLAGNGEKVAKFAARGGPQGAKNPRKSFQAELADPYAAPDDSLLPYVDHALRIVGSALVHGADTPGLSEHLLAAVPKDKAKGVMASLAYLRDRIGVPRDLPLAAGRYLRAYLNWGVDELRALT